MAGPVKQTEKKLFAGKAGPGRPKGVPNKFTGQLRDIILNAMEAADPGGSLGYLTKQAKENPTAFLTLAGKTLPMQVTGDGGGAVVHRIELVGVAPK
jgi:hypothetical protein